MPLSENDYIKFQTKNSEESLCNVQKIQKDKDKEKNKIKKLI